jgi:hypothetical protein
MQSPQEVRRRVLELHRSLIDFERRDYERIQGRLSDADFFKVLMTDPAFEWLGPLTALIVNLDELLEVEEPEPPTLIDDCLRQVRRLLTPDPSGNDFQRRYDELLQQSPDALVAHGQTVRALNG